MATLRSTEKQSSSRATSGFFYAPVASHMAVWTYVTPPPLSVAIVPEPVGFAGGEEDYVTWTRLTRPEEDKAEGNCLNEFCNLNSDTSHKAVLDFVRRWGPLKADFPSPSKEKSQHEIFFPDDKDKSFPIELQHEPIALYYQYAKQFRAARSLIYKLRKEERTFQHEWDVLFAPNPGQTFQWPDGSLPNSDVQRVIIADFLSGWLNSITIKPRIRWMPYTDSTSTVLGDGQTAHLALSEHWLAPPAAQEKVKNKNSGVDNQKPSLRYATASIEASKILVSLHQKNIKSLESKGVAALTFPSAPSAEQQYSLFVFLIWKLIGLATEHGYAAKCSRCGSLEISKRKPREDKGWYCAICQRLNHNELASTVMKRSRDEAKLRKLEADTARGCGSE